ncbi:MAG: exosortase/archaeosortase family protein [Deltaproteobacteria bacterium]|nr:exosortase/archaeosortase family protein [Deltaproteobacteria bacterium]
MKPGAGTSECGPGVGQERALAGVLLRCVLAGVFLLAFLPAWKDLMSAWNTNEDASHGYLIVPVCVWLLWRKRSYLKFSESRGSGLGLSVAVLSLLLYMFSQLAEIETLSSLSMIGFFHGAVLYLWGIAAYRMMLFPLFFLFFMVPVPSQIYSQLSLPLQLFVSGISAHIASLVGIPVYQVGNVIELPEKTLSIVKACSGVRSLVSILALCLLIGYVTMKSNVLRAVLFLSGIGVTILVNILRVILLIVFLYYFRIDLAHGVQHTLFGMIVFMVSIAFILVFRKGLSYWDHPSEEGRSS